MDVICNSSARRQIGGLCLMILLGDSRLGHTQDGRLDVLQGCGLWIRELPGRIVVWFMSRQHGQDRCTAKSHSPGHLLLDEFHPRRSALRNTRNTHYLCKLVRTSSGSVGAGKGLRSKSRCLD